MSFKRYAERPNREWRNFLTADEAEKVAAIDRETTVLDARRRELTGQRRTIQNRATQRALYHARLS